MSCYTHKQRRDHGGLDGWLVGEKTSEQSPNTVFYIVDNKINKFSLNL